MGLVTNISTTGNNQQITVGLNLAPATVTAVTVTVVSGPPLATVFTNVLTARPVLNALTAAVRAIPANLTEISPQGLSLPQQIVQTYAPKGSLFPAYDETLFQLSFSIAGIVARPLNATQPGPGVLVVGVDITAASAPNAVSSASTTGNRASLSDIFDATSSASQSGPVIEYGNGGSPTFAPGAPALAEPNLAVLINSAWVISLVNDVISPQLAGKSPSAELASNNVTIANSPDAVQLSFREITSPLNDPLPIPSNVPFNGFTLTVNATHWDSVNFDSLGYVDGGTGGINAVFSADAAVIFMSNASDHQGDPVPPNLTNDYYGVFVIGSEIQTPWWVDLVLAFLAAIAVSTGEGVLLLPLIVGGFWIVPSLLANYSAQGTTGLQKAISQEQVAQTVVQLPGLPTPDWCATITALGVASDSCYSYLDLFPLPAGRGSATGSYPYLVLTDAPVANPQTVPTTPGSPAFLARFDGSFTWPGIAYNQPGFGETGGQYNWDVHDLKPIGVVLTLPAGLFNLQDPTLFVQWTATRTDTNAVVISKKLGLNQIGALSISLDHASATLQAADQFQITCTLSQVTAGGTVVQIFNSGTVDVYIEDHFDRHHRYARWGPSLTYIRPGYPFWAAAGPTAPSTGRWVKNGRVSRIHRTDFWHGGRRCLVADNPLSMGNSPRAHPGRYGPGLSNRTQQAAIGYLGTDWCTYLDALPLSLAAAQADRNLAHELLCDYCFFGGPTKTQLRTDFP
ncbi:MAG: hypothetical protein WCE30_10180 [Mycobacterium sp.]